MEYKEFSAKTVEDAVIKASIELETASDHVEYEVIEKGSTGILGLFGSKPAVIRARVKEEAAAETEGITPVKEFEKESVKETETAKVEKAAAEKVEKTAKTEKAAENFDKGVYQKEKTAESEMKSASGEEQKNQETVSAGSDFDSDEYEKFLNDIFRIMDMEVKIESKFDEKNNMLDINLVGDDMGILIGRASCRERV